MSKNSGRQTCVACRRRKLSPNPYQRCDGQTPACGRCLKGGVACEYISLTGIPKAPALTRGNACLPCRKKKKRCDAKRPCCGACFAAHKAEHCDYEDNIPNSVVSSVSSVSRQNAVQVVRTPSRHSSIGSGSLSAANSSLVDLFFKPLSRTPPESTPVYLDPLIDPLVGNPFDFHLPPPSRLLTNHTSGDHVLRDVFLKRRSQLGMTLTDAKVEAIRRGDLSGAVIHPVIIPLATLMGLLWWQEMYTEFDTGREEKLVQAAEASIVLLLSEEGTMTRSRITLVMNAHTILGFYYLWRTQTQPGFGHLMKAADATKRLDVPEMLRELSGTVPNNLREPGLLSVNAHNEEEENVSNFCQILFLDCDARTLLQNAPLLIAEEDIDHFLTLKFVSPSVWDGNMTVASARASTLLARSLKFARMWVHAQVPPQRSDDMMARYWALLRDVSELAANMKLAYIRAAYSADELCHFSTLKSTLIKSLTAKAMVHWLLDNLDQSRRFAAESVCEIAAVTESLADEEYHLLDVVVSACWVFSAGILSRDYTMLRGIDAPDAFLQSNLTVLTTAFSRIEVILPFASDARQFCKDLNMGL